MSSAGRALAVVQARMSSSRLPGKTLADIEGEPMLALLLRRLASSRGVGEIVVATSTRSDDDPIARLAPALGARVSRGSLLDVLSRFAAAVGEHTGPVVRITGDCPLLDPALVDRVLELLAARPECVYASNIQPRTFPDGLDVEAIDADTLRALAADRLLSPEQREHVTSALRAQPQRYPAAALVGELDLGALRWTVDEAADLEFVRALVRRLGPRRHSAGLAELLAAVRRPPSLAGCGGGGRG